MHDPTEFRSNVFGEDFTAPDTALSANSVPAPTAVCIYNRRFHAHTNPMCESLDLHWYRRGFTGHWLAPWLVTAILYTQKPDAGQEKPFAVPCMPTGQYPDDLILVVCSTCHARLHPRWDQAGKKIICPDCGKTLRIPWPKRQQEKPPPRPEDIGEYGVRVAEKTVPSSTQFWEAQVIYARPVPPPPRWTFFSGVFQFPWYRDNISRWAILSFGLAVIGEMVAGALALFGVGTGDGVGSIAVVAMGFLIAPIAWSSIWTFSYAATLILAVVEETAAGNDEINWPDEDWRQRVWKFLYVGYLLVLAALAGAGVGALVQPYSGHFWLPLFATVYFVFPVNLLSSLEASSPWAPITPAILRSLIVRLWCWGFFYTETALVVAPCVALVFIGFYLRHPFWTAFLVAPPLSAVVLIYARLLGRLAWRITED